MKKIYFLSVFNIFLVFGVTFAQSVWQTLPDFPGVSRYASTGFAINGKGYVITGYHSSGPVLLNDTWEYDPATATWTQKANFPGTARWYASSFSIGGKGYLGMGATTNDFWEFDPSANTWTQKNDFPGSARAEGVAFSIGSKGYLGLGAPYGTSAFMKDFWEYNPLTDTWTQLSDFPGGPRGFAVSFTIGNKAYVGTGQSTGNYVHRKDLWEFDASNHIWTAKQDLPLERSCAVAFSIGAYGYIGKGQAPGSQISFPNDNWRYNPLSDMWDSAAPLPYYKWALPVTFTSADTAYIVTGFPSESKFWKYSETNIVTTVKEASDYSDLLIFPNPSSGSFCVMMRSGKVNSKPENNYVLQNELGQVVFQFKLNSSNNFSESLQNVPAGVYVIVDQKSHQAIKQKLVVIK